jgi:hypothetical protein
LFFQALPLLSLIVIVKSYSKRGIMKNLFLAIALLSSNLWANDLMQTKMENFKVIEKSFSKMIFLDTRQSLCYEVNDFLIKLYTVLEQDEALIKFLVNSGEIIDYDYAKQINENKTSNLFFILNLRDTCESDTPIDLFQIDKGFERSILNNQILKMQFQMFTQARG